jgi:hypothetical protein
MNPKVENVSELHSWRPTEQRSQPHAESLLRVCYFIVLGCLKHNLFVGIMFLFVLFNMVK